MKFFGNANLNVMDHISGKVLVKFDENGEAEVKDEALIEKMKIYFRFEEAADVEAENVEVNIPLEDNKTEESKTENENDTADTQEDIKENTNEEQELKPKKSRKKEVKNSEV